MNITSFSIHGLFGSRDLEIPIENNKLVIVAENGAGKTIILRLFYLFFSKQWNALVEYDFIKISALIDQKEYVFAKASYMQTTIPDKLIADFGESYPPYRKFFNEVLKNYSVEQLLNNEFVINDIESNFDVPKSLLFTVLNELSRVRFEQGVYDWKGSFLYLPTYRRIERGFEYLYGDIGRRIEQHIRRLIPEIDQKIESENLDNGFSETEEDIRSLFDTIWSTRDYERWAIHKPNFNFELIEFGMDDVQYRISYLLENKSQDTNSQIETYLEKCNKYLTNDKNLIVSQNRKYLEVKFPGLESHLSLTSLSAGEKQIISLFSYLLFNPDKTWVIIDEPELSLSMSWQEIILNDIGE